MPDKIEQTITKWKCNHCGFTYENADSAEKCEKRGSQNKKFLSELVGDILMWYELKPHLNNQTKWVLAYEFQQVVHTPTFYFGQKNCFHNYVVLYDINSNFRPNSSEYEIVNKMRPDEAFEKLQFMPNWNYITTQSSVRKLQNHIKKDLIDLWKSIRAYVTDKCHTFTLEEVYNFSKTMILQQYAEHNYRAENPCVLGPRTILPSALTWDLKIPQYEEIEK